MKTMWILGCLIIISAAGVAARPSATTDDGDKISFEKHIRPLLKKYCTKCHGGQKPKGDLNLEKFTKEADAVKKKELWERAAELLQSGEMPPKGAKPSVKELDTILDWIDRKVLDNG